MTYSTIRGVLTPKVLLRFSIVLFAGGFMGGLATAAWAPPVDKQELVLKDCSPVEENQIPGHAIITVDKDDPMLYTDSGKALEQITFDLGEPGGINHNIKIVRFCK